MFGAGAMAAAVLMAAWRCSPDNVAFEKKYAAEKISVADITLSVFDPASMFVKCVPSHGMFMACCIVHSTRSLEILPSRLVLGPAPVRGGPGR